MGLIMAGIGLPLIFSIPYYLMFAYYAIAHVQFRCDANYRQHTAHGLDAKND